MITLAQALDLQHNERLIIKGTNKFYRVNGKCKTWKTRPGHFKVPIKLGLYTYDYLTHDNAHIFIREREI